MVADSSPTSTSITTFSSSSSSSSKSRSATMALGFLRQQIALLAPTIPDVMQRHIFPAHPELARLAVPNTELNDDIINKYGELLTQKSRHRIHLFSSLRWSVEVERYSDVRDPHRWKSLREWFQKQKQRFMRKPKLQERLENMQRARYVFFPINDRGSHWILGVIDNHLRHISIYDSLNGENHDRTLKRLKLFAKSFINADGEWDCMLIPVHSQGLTLNCGVFVMAFMRSLAHSTHQRMDFTATDIPYLRALFGWELANGNVNTIGLY